MRPLILAVVLLFSSLAFGNSLGQNMAVCQVNFRQQGSRTVPNGCTWLPMAGTPTLSSKQTLSNHDQWALLFADLSGATYTVPVGQTWTQVAFLSWGEDTFVQRIIGHEGCAGCVYNFAFEMDIPKRPRFFKPTLFSLNTSLYDSNGVFVAGTRDNRFLFFEPRFKATVPEPGTLALLGTGLIGLTIRLRRWRP